MSMKKNDRKAAYTRIMSMMLNGQDKEAFEALVCLCGEDSGFFWLGKYELAKAAISAKAFEVGRLNHAELERQNAELVKQNDELAAEVDRLRNASSEIKEEQA